MSYNTKQQESILKYLTENKSRHVTAAEICSHFKENGIAVSTATVYRCLDRLCSQGTVKKYVIENNSPACYQFSEHGDSCHEHLHLKCLDCGKLFHLDCDHAVNVWKHVLEHHEFEIDNSKTVFYGMCGDCRRNKGAL